MKKLICTRADQKTHEMNLISHPLMEKYALKCKADFLVLNTGLPHGSRYCNDGKGIPHFYKLMQMKELLNAYQRILHLDTDMIINKDIENVFDFVPEDTIGTVYEDVGISPVGEPRDKARRKHIEGVQKVWKDIGWKSGYINTGFFMVSKQHKDVFNSYEGEYWCGKGMDDIHIGYMIKKYKFKVTDLAFKWNHMCLFSEPWNNSFDRFKSYIIHYAGRGIYNSGGVRSKIEQMRKDYKTIYG